MSTFLAGGGLRVGQVIGATDRIGAEELLGDGSGGGLEARGKFGPIQDVEDAFRMGADYIVIGRPIREAPDPRAAAAAIQARIAALFTTTD